MSVRPKTGSRSFATRTVLGLAVLCLACASVSRAQCVSAPANSVTLQDQGTVSIYPFVWAPGHSYTVTITGTYPTGFGAPTYCLGLSAWQWPDYPDYYQVGGYDSNIQISNPTWVSPTVTTFDVSVNSNAPTGKDFLELQVPGGEDFWGILIQPPPAPTQPSPPPPAPCATPALDPTNPVTPDIWIPGRTYNITVKGTGFTTQATSSLPQCPATTITVTVPTGSVALSNIVVVDSSTITATVTPAGTDPGETADITLWGPPEFDDDDDDQAPASAAPPSASPGPLLLQDAPSTAMFVPNVLPQSSAWQFPAAFSGLMQLPGPQTITLMAALAQPAMPRAVLAAAGAQTNSIPAGPSGMTDDGQATAQIDALKVIVTDASNIDNGIVTVKVTAPLGSATDISLDLGVTTTVTQDFPNTGTGTNDLKLNFDDTPPAIYSIANGSATNASILAETTIPDYSLSPWTYFRKVRFTQYNVPNENAADCTGNEVTAYIIDDNCNFTPITLKSDFIAAVWLNGTGTSMHHGILKNPGAVGPSLSAKGTLCKSTQFVGGKVQWPNDAIGYTPPGKNGHGNTFAVVSSVTGYCNKTLVDHVSAAMPVDSTLHAAPLSGVVALSCGKQLNLDDGSYSTTRTETVADKCTACSNPATFTNSNGGTYSQDADGHVDSYTSLPDCHASPGTFQDLAPNPFYTSYRTK